ncbi:MAG: ATP-binding cassette domain-containing protein [Phycisphaerae bacterium]|nr:ATP-binding cassette domain-containing protein [Phycisphaerae bacterium]
MRPGLRSRIHRAAWSSCCPGKSTGDRTGVGRAGPTRGSPAQSGPVRFERVAAVWTSPRAPDGVDSSAAYAGRVDQAPVEIRAEALTRSFGTRTVLRSISLTVRSGEMVAIVGTSGCGKTVLLDHLTGLLTPDSGRVLAADHTRGTVPAPLVDLAEIDSDRLDEVRLFWAIVFQRNALFSGTVYENIALWLREHTEMTEPEILQRARESLRSASLDPDEVLGKDRDALSGGMAKRVAVARAIAEDPAVIFYDEPTTGLDPVVSGHVHELVWNTHHRRRADGLVRTSVIVTHDKELLRRIGPRVVMLDEGAVCYDGSYERFGSGDSCAAARQYLRAMPVLHAAHKTD